MTNKKLTFTIFRFNGETMMLCLLRDDYFIQLYNKHLRKMNSEGLDYIIEAPAKLNDNLFVLSENQNNPLVTKMFEIGMLSFETTQKIKVTGNDLEQLEKASIWLTKRNLSFSRGLITVELCDEDSQAVNVIIDLI